MDRTRYSKQVLLVETRRFDEEVSWLLKLTSTIVCDDGRIIAPDVARAMRISNTKIR